MKFYSAREAAKRLGIPYTTFATYISMGKVPTPENEFVGETTTTIWTGEEIEHVRQLLPKIANGRKTRHKNKTKAQPKSAVPHKKRSSKKPKPASG